MDGTSKTLSQIRETRPLIHHITNWVTISQCANVTLLTGALPVMAHSIEEVEEMVGIASALVLNIGTLTPTLVDSMEKAALAANARGIPVVMDAVGAGATRLRTDSAKRLMHNTRIDVLKGNAGEIATLAGAEAEVKGVESMGVNGDISEFTRELAQNYGATVAATGVVDIVSDGEHIFKIKNGHPLMGRVVGTGCMSTSVIAAFCAVEKDHARAAAQALTYYGIAGELGAEDAKGPGTFLPLFFDALENMDMRTIDERARSG